MKINKMLIAIPAMLAVVLSSCKDDDPTVGIDSSMPAPAEVSYDEMNSSSSSIGVYWDANAALKSGATSFTVQILKKKDVGGDAYDNTVYGDHVDYLYHSGFYAYLERIRANSRVRRLVERKF